MTKVTIEEISRRTGLSRGTVSRALNDRPDISQKTKERVLAECLRLNYVPNRAARSLATGRMYAVAALLPALRDEQALAFLRGAVRAAADAGYLVSVVEIPAVADDQVRVAHSLANGRVDGLLISGPLTPTALAILKDDFATPRRIVSCVELSGVACDVVRPDLREAGALAARHVAAARPRDAAFVADPAAGHAETLLAGCRSELDRLGIPLRVAALDADSRSLSDTAAGAYVCAADRLAIAACDALVRAGRTPGRDVAVVGYGGSEAGSLVRPSVASVDPNMDEVGSRTFDLFLQRVTRQRSDGPQLIEVAPALISRESTAHCAPPT